VEELAALLTPFKAKAYTMKRNMSSAVTKTHCDKFEGVVSYLSFYGSNTETDRTLMAKDEVEQVIQEKYETHAGRGTSKSDTFKGIAKPNQMLKNIRKKSCYDQLFEWNKAKA
jgi:hypothetical protein